MTAALELELPIAIRRLTPAEASKRHDCEALRFVLSAWLAQSNKDRLTGAGWSRGLSYGEYFSGQHDLIVELCRRGRVDVATVPDAPELYLGWVVTEPGILHYGYVKTAYRGAGIFRRLLEHAGPLERYTHKPRGAGPAHLRRRGLMYSPYSLMLRDRPTPIYRDEKPEPPCF